MYTSVYLYILMYTSVHVYVYLDVHQIPTIGGEGFESLLLSLLELCQLIGVVLTDHYTSTFAVIQVSSLIPQSSCLT